MIMTYLSEGEVHVKSNSFKIGQIQFYITKDMIFQIILLAEVIDIEDALIDGVIHYRRGRGVESGGVEGRRFGNDPSQARSEGLHRAPEEERAYDNKVGNHLGRHYSQQH